MSGVCLGSACLKCEGLKLKHRLMWTVTRAKNPNSPGWDPSPARREGAAAALSSQGPGPCGGHTDPSWGREESPRALAPGTDLGRAAPSDTRGHSWVLCFWGSLPCPCAIPGCPGQGPEPGGFYYLHMIEQSALEETLPRVSPRFHASCGSDGLAGAVPAGFGLFGISAAPLRAPLPQLPPNRPFRALPGSFSLPPGPDGLITTAQMGFLRSC